MRISDWSSDVCSSDLAIADGVDGFDAKHVAHGVDRAHLRPDIILGGDVLQRFVGGLPRNDEYRMALLDRPSDEALLRRQVQNVEAVDPGREDQERLAEALFRRGIVLDELKQIGSTACREHGVQYV